MKKLIIVFCVTFLTTMASYAQDSETGYFGLKNITLGELFLEEALEIANRTSAEDQGLTKGLSRIDEFEILDEARRVDPDAALDLIERIRRAGGKV